MFENNPFSNNPFSQNTSPASPSNSLFNDTTGSEETARLNKLLAAAEDAIKYGDFEGDRFNKGADSFLEEIIETLPREVWAQNPRFYLVKMMINHRVTNDRELAAIGDELLTSIDFRRARDYAKETDPTAAARIEAIVAEIEALAVQKEQNTLAMIQEMFEIKEDGKGAYILVKAKNVPEHLVIPSGYFSVIGEAAFEGCRILKSVTIPNGVTKIECDAFEECTSLTSVTIPDSVTCMQGGVFFGCTSLVSITIPNSVTCMQGGMFSGCTSLVSITIPNSVTNFTGYEMFDECTSLTSVSLPNSLDAIHDNMFNHCSSLTSITIPDSVEAICENAFFDCSSLTSITIPNNVWTIHDAAFGRCTSLTSVTIPNGFCAGWTADDIRQDGLGEDIFLDDWNLASITLPEHLRELEDYIRPHDKCKMIYT